MNPGTIIYDNEFQFSDGKTINKLIVVLSDYGTNYLVAKTTTQQYSKSREAGCHSDENPPNFYIPKGACWFRGDTWIELDEAFELDGNILSYKQEDGVVVIHENVLEKDLIQKIMACALASKRVDQIDKDCIARALKKL